MTEMCLSRPGEAGAGCGGQPCFHGTGTTPPAEDGAGPCEGAETTSVCFCLSLRLLSFALSFIINLSRSPSPLPLTHPPRPFLPARRLPQGRSGKGWESI